jgi:hypothetical protein
MITMQHFEVRCHARGKSPFTFQVVARTAAQAIAMARITYPNHFYTLTDRDQPAFIA